MPADDKQDRFRPHECGMGRKLTFRVPRHTSKPPRPLIVSDRAATLLLLFSIQKQTDAYTPELVNPAVYRVLQKFDRPPTSLLYIPRNLQPSPFEYYCTVNEGDSSFQTEPRLLVTKLLTGLWCELQLFYDVYAGLRKKQQTTRLTEGSEYHDKLEKEEHALADLTGAEAELAEVAAKHSEEDTLYLGRNLSLAIWCKANTEHVIKRGINLAHTRHAREIAVHAYVNLETGNLATEEDQFEDSVLVNGIADIVQFEPKNKEAAEGNSDISADNLLQEFSGLSLSSQVWDLSRLIPEAEEELQRDYQKYNIQVRDVKTRGTKSLPKSKLQLNAARLQCMYYTRFLRNLMRNQDFAYASYQENARRRQVDPDSHIGEAHATVLLLQNFEALALDYVRLAKGEDIGYETHDSIMREMYSSEEEAIRLNYNLSRFISEEQFRSFLRIVYGDDLASDEVDISPLFNSWRYPLTARFFLARSTQILYTLRQYESSTVCVDYHHAKSSTLISSLEYPYHVKEVNAALKDAAMFWSGKRQPRGTDSEFKCQNCDYRSRCPVLNKQSQQSIGALIYHDLLS